MTLHPLLHKDLPGNDDARDTAYAERNRCVVAMAHIALKLGWNAGTAQHPADDLEWEDDWRTIVYIDSPAGQLSWHFHDAERWLLEGLPSYDGTWDGHTTDEKYERMLQL